MSGKEHVAIYGHFGGWNAGDEIILESVVHAVRARRPDAKIDVISSGFHARALDRYAEFDVQPVRMKSADCLKTLRSRRLIAGGGQMMTGDVSLKGLIALLVLTSVSRAFGGQPLLLCIGTQGIERRSARLLARLIVANTTATIARDRESFDELAAAGSEPPTLLGAADVVFNGAVVDLAAAAPEASLPTTSGPTILVVLHWSSLRTLVSAKAGENMLRHLEATFPESTIVVQSHDRREAFDDGGVAALEALGGWSRVIFERYESLDAVFTNYRAADVIVSARMHPLIVATVLDIPSVVLRGSRKTKALAERIGLPLGAIDELDALTDLISTSVASGAPKWTHLKELVDVAVDQHL